MMTTGDLGVMPPENNAPQMDVAQVVVHAVETAAYSNLGFQAYGHQCPFIACTCGWESGAGLRWWEEVGEEYDEHLRLVAIDVKHGLEG